MTTIRNEALHIQGLGGEKKLSGTLSIEGAKNAALPLLAATLLIDGDVTITNIPSILDTNRSLTLLENLGVTITPGKDHEYTFTIPSECGTELDEEISKHMRASIIFSGPVLARSGSVRFPHPGGCVIGERPIDLFLSGYEALGAAVEKNDDGYVLTAPKDGLKGSNFFFIQQSVTATETLMMAAVMAHGTTVLGNAAVEPEIVDLALFLKKCGARITGEGTHTITIEGTGGVPLTSPEEVYTVMPDRIETGSFLIIGALCAQNLTITNCNPEHVEILTQLLQDSGVPLRVEKDSLHIENNTVPNSDFSSFSIKTHEYPGFPTDLQAPAVIFLTQVTGEAKVFETIFEGRLRYLDDIMYMGADIERLDIHRALVRGPRELEGRRLSSPDIRAGLAYIVAALVAHGESYVSNMMYVDRGYENIEKKLESIGVQVKRVTD